MTRPIPITIRGVKYKSIAAAARAIGVSPGTIHEARAAGRLERVGLGKRPAKADIAPDYENGPFAVDVSGRCAWEPEDVING